MCKASSAGKVTAICKGRSAIFNWKERWNKELQSRAGKAEVEPYRKPRPVAKQLESPVEAAARGPKVLKGPGGSLGSVRRNCVQGFNRWQGHWDLRRGP